MKLKVIKRRKTDTKGVAITYIPQYRGDPVQSAKDEHFYFRSGDNFHKAPYDMIRRLFSTTKSPDIKLTFETQTLKKNKKGFWEIPMTIENKSITIADKIKVFMWIDNFKDCSKVEVADFINVSYINKHLPCAYVKNLEEYVYKGLSWNLGDLDVIMKGRIRSLTVSANLFADGMIPKNMVFKLTLSKGKLIQKIIKEEHMTS